MSTPRTIYIATVPRSVGAAVVRPVTAIKLTPARSTTTPANLTSVLTTSQPQIKREPSPEMSATQLRKRQRLDHLSMDEKLMRRKMKNRVAAQTARDRKKARMDELDDQVAELQQQMELLRKQNSSLREKNEILQLENCELREQLSSSSSSSIVSVPTPPASPAPANTCIVASPANTCAPPSIESAALISVPLQWDQEGRLLAAVALLQCLCWVWAGTVATCSGLWPTSPSHWKEKLDSFQEKQNRLPAKKRSHLLYWSRPPDIASTNQT